ncbi:hypothetical protein, partial [Undibacterium sp.]|uniref:hypothetical protein n=1 Tax=Undibacterium sp. TaxID=1914977 RepID=UPI00374CF8DD
MDIAGTRGEKGEPDFVENRILIFAPTGRDGSLTARVLTGAGVACCICASPWDVSQQLEQGV